MRLILSPIMLLGSVPGSISFLQYSRIWCLLSAIFLGPSVVFAQNLILNSGFDSLTQCPDNAGQLSYASPWISSIGESPDLYNECSTGLANVPHSFTPDHFQLPRSGRGYAGLYAYFGGSGSANEYIQAPLIKVLSKDKPYYLRFFVVPYSGILFETYSDAVALALTTEQIKVNYPQEAIIRVEPAIEHRGTLIKDTANWTKISGCYTAKGGERFATVGNFRPNSQTLTEPPNSQGSSYLFIEDVLVMGFDPLPDTILLCSGQPRTFDATFLDATYSWNTGSALPTEKADQAGLLTIAANMGNCILRDTAVVIDTREVPETLPDTLICQGDVLRLSAPLPGAYQWSTGATTRDITVTDSGFYEVTINNTCGIYDFASNIMTKECACHIYVPNIFSPNGDGQNDRMDISVGCDFQYQFIRFQVFNRWGELVFSTTDPVANSWDGTFNGQMLPPGPYVWTLTYEYQHEGKNEAVVKYGDITITR